MEKTIIKVSHLSKKYKLGSDQPYLTFRDSLTAKIRNPLSFFKPAKIPQEELGENEFWALKDVSFDIHQGEVMGIIGRNGAGKSTLLKLLSRITIPTKGEMKLSGRVGSLLEVGTGFHPELTGRENIFLNGAILGMKRSEIKKKFSDIVEFAEVKKFIDTPVKYYSSGMYTRLAFSVGAFLDTEILIIDEILAVGDSAFQKKCIEKMKDITDTTGRTILLVSHNMLTVQKLCTRSILLDKGEIKIIGKTEEVIQSYLNEVEFTNKLTLVDRKDRLGSGGLRVTNISFKDKNGKDISHIKAGDEIQIWVEYKLKDVTVKHIEFSISIDSFYNQYRLATISNKIINQRISTRERIIKIKLPKLTLNIGKYQYTIIIISEGGDILDWIQQAGIFEVEYGDYYKTGFLPNTDHGNLLLDYTLSDKKA